MADRIRRVAAWAARHRRLVAALCAGAAVLVAVSAVTPSAPARGEASGVGVGLPAPPPAALVPAAAGARAPGDAERVAVAVRLTDPAGLLLLRVGAHARVLAGRAADGALPVPANAPATDDGAQIVAEDAVVLAVPAPPGRAAGALASAGGEGSTGLLGGFTDGAVDTAAGTGGGLDGVVLLAVLPSDARRLAAAASSQPLSVAVGLPSPTGGAP